MWEPVLLTDWTSPSSATLRRISDSRTEQFWDKGRLISRSIGNQENRRGIVWDYIAVYPPGALWGKQPPEPAYQGGPVLWVNRPAREAVAKALQGVADHLPSSE
ncbi:MAG: hypothetical protein WAM39_32185 [Bryobacteraceae bacterium]